MGNGHTTVEEVRVTWLCDVCVCQINAVMTSLAHQLKRLALPQSDPTLLTRREVASLLFDPKDAATMDRSTFYALGESPPPDPGFCRSQPTRQTPLEKLQI